MVSWHRTEALKDDWRGPDGKSRQCIRGGNWKVSTEIVRQRETRNMWIDPLSRDRKSILPDTQSGVGRTLDNQRIEVAFRCRVSDALVTQRRFFFFLQNALRYRDFIVLEVRGRWLGPIRARTTTGACLRNMFHGYDVCGVRICAIRYPGGTSGAGSIKYSHCPEVILIDQQFRKLSTYRVQIRWRLQRVTVQLPTDKRSATIKIAMCALLASVVSEF